jgi:hypothetical protein
MSQVLDKLERLAEIGERLEGFTKYVPRLVEMFGVAFLAGKASQTLGGDFATGALGGAIADGLAHSQLPNNQIGGIALGTYFSALGILTIAPTEQVPFLNELLPAPRLTTSLTREECAAQGGVWIEGILGGGCRLPDI